jgi:hypothetical protein
MKSWSTDIKFERRARASEGVERTTDVARAVERVLI